MAAFLSAKAQWNFNRILPFGFIWLVTGWAFLVSDKLAIGDGPVGQGVIDLTTEVIVFASFVSFLFGLVIGGLEVILVNRLVRGMSLVRTIIYKFVLYAAIFVGIVCLAYPLAASIELGVSVLDPAVWEKFYLFWGSNAYYSTGIQSAFSLFLSLIYAAISEHLGHSVLVNFFLGKYHTPKQEKRMFMFVDMYASTTIAENLGHIRYFQFLQQYYDDLADAIIAHHGEVYQYIGDEIVITWPLKKGAKNRNALCCFFAMESALEKRAERYEREFGHVPKFKAGLHLGEVTTGEVGALKKEIVFTGDVLNTTARIQGLCSALGHHFLVSEKAYRVITETVKDFKFTKMEDIELKGKKDKVAIFGVGKK